MFSMKIRQALGGHWCGRSKSTNGKSIPFGKLMQIKSSVKSVVPILQPPCLLSLPCWHATSTIFSSLKCSFVWHRAPTWIRGYRAAGSSVLFYLPFYRRGRFFLTPFLPLEATNFFILLPPEAKKILAPFLAAPTWIRG